MVVIFLFFFFHTFLLFVVLLFIIIKQDKHLTHETKQALASIARSKGTKKDGVEAVDIDEKAMTWAGDVIGNARERELNFDKRKPSEIPLPSFLLEKSEKSEDEPQEDQNENQNQNQNENQETDNSNTNTNDNSNDDNSNSGNSGNSGNSNDVNELKALQGQALLIDQKFERAEKAGKVGEKLPADLVGNAEATSETFWKDLGTFKIQTFFSNRPKQ